MIKFFKNKIIKKNQIFKLFLLILNLVKCVAEIHFLKDLSREHLYSKKMINQLNKINQIKF